MDRALQRVNAGQLPSLSAAQPLASATGRSRRSHEWLWFTYRRGGGPGGGGGVWRGNNPSIMQNYNPRTPPPMASPGLHAAGLPTNGMSGGAQNNNAMNANDAGPPGKNNNIPPALPPAHLLVSPRVCHSSRICACVCPKLT